MLTAQDIYTAAQALSLPEHPCLAALLLDELAPPPRPLSALPPLPGTATSGQTRTLLTSATGRLDKDANGAKPWTGTSLILVIWSS